MARPLSLVDLQQHGNVGALALKDGLQAVQPQLQAAQIAVPHPEAGQCAACYQKGEGIAQIELKVDAGHQQHHQCGSQCPACRRGHHIDIALLQRVQRVGALAACCPVMQGLPPAAACGVWGVWHHGMAMACNMARTCSTVPRPALATACRRCAMVCTKIACTSSGET